MLDSVAPSMLEHDIDIGKGWQAAWLSRSLRPLQCYTTISSYTLSLLIICLGVGGFVAIRRSTKQLANDPSNRPAIFSSMNKKLLKITKGHFFVANVYLMHVFVISIIDALICFKALKDDVSSSPETWTPQLIAELALYTAYLLLIFSASFFLVPLLQMLAVTWLLGRFNLSRSLSEYIPEARFFSTHIAQIWCMLCYFVVSWWAPTSDGAHMPRYVVLQACLGSAVAWLEASFALNFRFERLADKEFQLSSAPVRRIVGMFRETVWAVHTNGVEKTLPTHKAATVESSPLTKEEREFRNQSGR